MKWPEWMMFIRHDVSVYNALKKDKKNNVTYNEFLTEFKKDKHSLKTKDLAQLVADKFALNIGDAETPLAEDGKRAQKVGRELRKKYEVPDIIFVSPYKRTLETLKNIIKGWPELKKVKIVEEERIREQEHGLSLIYNDWKVFHVLHPDQGKLFDLEGLYWYRFPQGENVPDVRLRNRSWLSSIVRDFSNKKIMVVTHGLNIQATRANLERYGERKFLEINSNESTINCGVTLYKGNPNIGKSGHLELEFYNKKLY